MNELALFTGAGGGLLGGKLLGWNCICAVEKEPYCREVLLRRQRDGVLPLFPIWDDIRTFDGRPWRGKVDIVTAGFPCQPFSSAGQRKGKDDDRNLWPETMRVVREVEPALALLENVPNLLSYDYFGQILGDLAEAGFDARWDVVSAVECGAPHLRRRLWILAHAQRKVLWNKPGWIGGTGGQDQTQSRDDGEEGDVANANSDGGGEGRAKPQIRERESGALSRSEPLADTEEFPEREQADEENPLTGAGKAWSMSCCGGWWAAEPDVGRVADGVAFRVDRLRALGNGQVPAVVRRAWRDPLRRKEG